MKEKKEHISGIYNYCDRWCERCSFTANCLLFTQESRISAHEIMNNGELPTAEEMFAKEMEDFDEEIGDDVDFLFDDDDDEFFIDDDFDDDEFEQFQKEREERLKRIEEEMDNPLSNLANDYCMKAHELLKELDEKYDFYDLPKESLDDTEFNKLYENFEVFAWFHAFIYVKINRAWSSKIDIIDEDDEEMIEIHKYDMDGTAKIAIIGINRSIKALNNLLDILPEYSEQISELLVLLGKVLNLAEEAFPDHKEFVRPGLDE